MTPSTDYDALINKEQAMSNLMNAIALTALYTRYRLDQANGPKVSEQTFARQNAFRMGQDDLGYTVY